MISTRASSRISCASAAVLGSAAVAMLMACHRDVQATSRDEPGPTKNHAAVAAASSSLESDSPAVASAAPHRPAPPARKAPSRVVAIGDIHGDLAAARRAFRAGRLIDDNDRWIGGSSVAVQTGDLLDRGTDERQLLDWIERLAGIAEASGGAIYRLSGNHEVMNVAGDLRYVTDKGFEAFAEYAQGPLPDALREAPAAARGRLMAFLPGGPWAKRLAPHPAVLIVNDSVFTHGGLVPKHLTYGLERMNTELAAWMRGLGKLSPMLAGDEAPYWNRTYGDAVTESDCNTLAGILAELGVKRLVIGHTPQKGGISFACNRQVARIDVGLSSYYGNNPASVLEVDGDKVTVLTEATSAPRKQLPRATRGGDAHP